MAFKLAEIPRAVCLQGTQDMAKAGHRYNIASRACVLRQTGAAPLWPDSSPARGHVGKFLHPAPKPCCRGVLDIIPFLSWCGSYTGIPGAGRAGSPEQGKSSVSAWEKESLNHHYQHELAPKFQEGRISLYLLCLLPYHQHQPWHIVDAQ